MKIYTRSGDDGTTGLRSGARVRKDTKRIQAYGTVDELNASIGFARCTIRDARLAAVLERIQVELFGVGAELSTTGGAQRGRPSEAVSREHIERLEGEIDAWEEELAPLKNFVLPGGCPAAAALHVARTVCRRAERRVLALAREEHVPHEIVVYLNRLGDHLFVASREANRLAGVPDVLWAPSAEGGEPQPPQA